LLPFTVRSRLCYPSQRGSSFGYQALQLDNATLGTRSQQLCSRVLLYPHANIVHVSFFIRIQCGRKVHIERTANTYPEYGLLIYRSLDRSQVPRSPDFERK